MVGDVKRTDSETEEISIPRSTAADLESWARTVINTISRTCAGTVLCIADTKLFAPLVDTNHPEQPLQKFGGIIVKPIFSTLLSGADQKL